MKKTASCVLLSGLLLAAVSHASAMIKPSQRHEAGGSKTGRYFSDGFFAGGEKLVTAARLKDVRRANSQEGYERIVLDLEGQGDDKNALPYFQVQAAPQEGRLILSIWADVGYEFDTARVAKTFAKSGHVKRLNIMPRVEDGLSIIEFQLNSAVGKAPKFEVFRLSNPARIIMDVI